MTNTSESYYSIYLSGKITGDPNYKEKFGIAANILRHIYPAAKVFNPAFEFAEIAEKLKAAGVDEKTGHDILVEICLKTLREYEAIAFMPDWAQSAGAIAELDAAFKRGMKPIRLGEDLTPI